MLTAGDVKCWGVQSQCFSWALRFRGVKAYLVPVLKVNDPSSDLPTRTPLMAVHRSTVSNSETRNDGSVLLWEDAEQVSCG